MQKGGEDHSPLGIYVSSMQLPRGEETNGAKERRGFAAAKAVTLSGPISAGHAWDEMRGPSKADSDEHCVKKFRWQDCNCSQKLLVSQPLLGPLNNLANLQF